MSALGPITHFGPDALVEALAGLRARGIERPLLISGTSSRHAEHLDPALAGWAVRRFTGARVHVPRATVDAATAALAEHEADAIITVGGSSATGLGKALRLHHALPFVAIPTTYAGSEMTRIYGITDGNDKTTGRDDRVRPDAVAYVPALLATLPPSSTVQSLFNAMAHPISALSTGTLGPDARAEAVDVVAKLLRATVKLAERPQHRAARIDAARGCSAAARILDAHAMGDHHRVAHRLGGRFDLPHAPLHSVLLLASLRGLESAEPDVYRMLITALPEADPLAALFDALTLVDAPTSIPALGVEAADARAAVEETLGPIAWLEPALLGRRPSTLVQWHAWEHGPALSVFGDPSTATDVVLAIHGRGATADAIVQRAREIVGDAPKIAIVAPQADGPAWYAASYRSAYAEAGPAVQHAVQTTTAARQWVATHAPAARVHLFGFSQGACVALEVAATCPTPFASVVALAGARVGPVAARPAIEQSLRDVPVLLGVAHDDRWVDHADVEATALALAAAGARVQTLRSPGDAHEISGRQRIRARELITGRGTEPGGHGFGNAHASEALPGALPPRQNSPRRAAYGLYPEQWSGTGFVAPRHENLRTWVYRLRPAAGHRPFAPLPHPTLCEDFAERPPEPNLVGYRPLPMPTTPTDFVDGLHTFGGHGRAASRRGFAIHLYAANRSMEHRAFYDADGDLLIMPQQGVITLRTELGNLEVDPGHLAIVPRGIKFSVLLHEPYARGFVGEVFGRHFELPDRGVVGANGLADERHFVVPSAWFCDRPQPGFVLTAKFGGHLHQTTLDRSPFDVVAWHGRYTPYAYDLAMFSPVSNVAFDHIDPSAYLVLSAPLDERGADALDLVVFPPRWDVTEQTLRPPFFHRNVITEFNGIVRETASEGSPFAAGSYFVTPSMTAHGVVDRAVERAIGMTDAQANHPTRSSDRSLWFQFETAVQLSLSRWAATSENRVDDWPDVWGRYRSYYDPHGGG
ncbi:MAG: homogentisate 1,2-dioxygenase [Deltaproteobacteria bacterium]|nr:homogentisate 1,2-dioxygenase [Deltaproteobacteria bacterium]